MTRASRGPSGLRWSALPRLISGAPPLLLLIVGGLALLLGLLIVTRPLTSIVVLTVYVGLSALASGVAELAGRERVSRWRRILAALWAVAGLAVLIGLGRSLEVLPDVLAYLLMLGGLASLYDAFTQRGTSRRVLAVSWGVAQIAFGFLALAWPDVTILVVAIVFGARTVVFGVVTLVRGIRGMRRAVDAGGELSRTARGWMAAGRYALSVVLLAVAAVGWWGNGWVNDRATVVDAFYDPPAVVPLEHGSLIRSDEFQGQHPRGGSVTRILYTTRDALGQPAVASALVIAPDDPPPGARPVIAWNHGTTGVARGCAPSLRDASATKWAIPALDQAMERGWIVVASDYSGQGAPGVFPYLIGRGEARSSLDAVLAARELDGIPTPSERTMSWGHSQGGHAALWMSKIAPDYAPSVRIQGTAVLAPVTDPLALAGELTQGEGGALLSILTSWVLVPYADTYDDVDLARYVAPGAEAIVREMTQRCPTEPGVVVSVATALGVSVDRPLYLGDLTTGPLGEHLADNAATGPWGTPLLVAWGDEDEVIPPRLQEEFVAQVCAEGERVRALAYRGYDHLGTLLPRSSFLPVLIDWTDTVLQRQEPHDDCAA